MDDVLRSGWNGNAGALAMFQALLDATLLRAPTLPDGVQALLDPGTGPLTRQFEPEEM